MLLPHAHEILREDEEFPLILREIPGCPERIFCIGNFDFEKNPLIAIVGTRKATPEGLELAKRVAMELGRRGVGVVSGLALGIDAAAHEGALRGGGKTVAVLANGLQSVYPRQHENLSRNILEQGGALISEYPAGTPPLPHQFLERNRIISGLALATIVIEAPIHSGAIRTAREAAEQGREVLVFSGPAEHPNYAGSHALIRSGARLVHSFADIVEDLASLFGGAEETTLLREDAPLSEPESETNRIIAAIQNAGGKASTEELLEILGGEPSEILSALAILSLEGIIEERAGFFYLPHS
jgi:DNA processing protein